jgi:hypothetical protein
MMIFLVAVAIIAGGLGYSFFSAPEQPTHQLVKAALDQFELDSLDLESQFQKNQRFSDFNSSINIDISSRTESFKVNMQGSNSKVLLTFPANAGLVANQTILLEPFIKESEVRWKCINGTVLVRLRPKPCRIGNGLSRHSRFE